MKLITREEIKEKINKWQNDDSSSLELKKWAESVYSDFRKDTIDFTDYEKDELNSISKEVIILLDSLDMNLIIKDDADSLIELLKTKIGEFDKGMSKQDNYVKSINLKERKGKLSNDSFYSKYCK